MIDKQSSIHDVKFVFFDFETTGLNANKDNPIEIGAIKCTTTEILETYSTFIHFEGSIPYEAAAVNKITDAMLKNAPSLKEVLQKFLNLIKDSVLVAHNIFFDFTFLNSALSRNSLPTLVGVPLIDTLKIAKKVLPNQRSFSLEGLSKDLELRVPQHHRALDDAQACRSLLFYCIDKISIMGDLPLGDLLL